MRVIVFDYDSGMRIGYVEWTAVIRAGDKILVNNKEYTVMQIDGIGSSISIRVTDTIK